MVEACLFTWVDSRPSIWVSTSEEYGLVGGLCCWLVSQHQSRQEHRAASVFLGFSPFFCLTLEASLFYCLASTGEGKREEIRFR